MKRRQAIEAKIEETLAKLKEANDDDDDFDDVSSEASGTVTRLDAIKTEPVVCEEEKKAECTVTKDCTTETTTQHTCKDSAQTLDIKPAGAAELKLDAIGRIKEEALTGLDDSLSQTTESSLAMDK